MGDVRCVISESVGQRAEGKELSSRKCNVSNLDSTNLKVNHQEAADLHTATEEVNPTGLVSALSQDTRDLIESSNVILARVNTQQGDLVSESLIRV